MSVNEIKGEKNISQFPPPFRQDMTPYNEFEFSESVKTACSSYEPYMFHLKMGKVIVIGDVGVGKTSLVNRFCRQIYNYDYKATIGVDFEMERFNILNTPFNLQIWDTAGQERFKCIAGAYYRNAHVIIMVFDLSSGRSLQNCPIWLREAMESNMEEPLKFLVGAKRDLLADSIYDNIEGEAGEIAKCIGAEYWSVSSKSGSQVGELFSRIAAMCFERIMRSVIQADGQTRVHRLGLTLKDENKVNKLQKKDVHCEVVPLSCRF